MSLMMQFKAVGKTVKQVKVKLPNTLNYYVTNNLFAVSEGRGDYHFRLYFNESDGLFYMELGEHLTGKSDYESMTTVKIILQEWGPLWSIRLIRMLA